MNLKEDELKTTLKKNKDDINTLRLKRSYKRDLKEFNPNLDVLVLRFGEVDRKVKKKLNGENRNTILSRRPDRVLI